MEHIYPNSSINDKTVNTQFNSKVLWMSGLSGSGKSTIANILQQILKENDIASYILDGDNIRYGLNADLDFSEKSRTENIRRIAEVSKLFKDSGLLVITSFITPYKEARELAKSIIGDDFIEIYINASLETCIERDVKGLYKKAIDGEIKKFTGISDVYDIPESPDIIVDSNKNDIGNVNKCANDIYEYVINNLNK